ncbi:putative fatty-acid--CoA ligase fadD25 [Oryza brachyantha]|uniref:putative fatty-acid--CoA ligase fadD25 n=1 Tax=Oryza brachyantha TaxID=4533 RepID=UPI001ADAFFEF|nr:putative fatty-acid--CoA ligase fadD25 [Oryza brachyantha]
MSTVTENYDPCYPDQPVVHRYLPVWAKLPSFGAKPAFVWADDGAATAGAMSSYAALTYSQLDSAVERMASGLLGTLRRADTVLVLASPGLRLVKLLFACQRAGLTAVPVIPPDPSRHGAAHAHLLRIVSQTRPRAAVADARYVDAVMESAAVAGAPDRLTAMLRSLRWLSVDELEHGGANGAAPVRGCEPEDAYLIQYTSGATGVPKPVVITAGAAAHNVRAARKAYDMHPGSVVVSWLPQYHDCGLMFLLLTVVAGATCVLASPDAFVRRPRLWLELVAEFKATCTPVPSFALPLVLRRGRSPDERRPPLELGSLENLILINEPIYKSCVDEFVAEFRRDGLHAASISPSYGLAENCTFVSTAWRSRCVDLPPYRKLLPSARLSRVADDEPEIEIAVVDEETCEPVEDGVEGEIWVRSPSNGSGYLGHPSASREVFCARLPGKAGSSCFVRTGDRGVVRGAERYLYVLGRSADVLALDGGQRSAYAHYIETAAFGSTPGRLRGGCIAAFTAVAAPSTSLVVLVAELVKESGGGGGGDHKGICESIRRAAWEEEGVRVTWIVLVESGVVPKTTSGKLRRRAARDKLLAGKLPTLFEARYDVTESSVPGIGGEEEMECAAMSTAYGSASRRLRLQSFL